ncbi:hypothetical protein PAXRUDRAFT_829653 [Paxillus rubicundulus Ve08.2h10]|uniref:Uncharacterized protein n=1 Tax=Paxillus rubicundulus Ve08.2h10 TaxID=930991 RepID=A0A0D0DMC8_9AGAM|nr:hypothetical protein PAXRUDRAFT_829653 [Paxillus rubicundulus Ve08.2h10]
MVDNNPDGGIMTISKASGKRDMALHDIVRHYNGTPRIDRAMINGSPFSIFSLETTDKAEEEANQYRTGNKERKGRRPNLSM